MILLHTTVLVYAVGDEQQLKAPCRRLLQAHADGQVEAATTVEVVQEFVHVRARRRLRADAVALGRRYAQALTLLMTGPDDLELGLTLFDRHPELGAFDAMLAAVALNQRVDALVSADLSFAAVTGLPWRDPASA